MAEYQTDSLCRKSAMSNCKEELFTVNDVVTVTKLQAET
jgi:hypothetical protein